MVSQSDADTSSHTTGRMSSSKARVQIVGRVSGRRNWTVEQKLAIIGDAFTSGSSVASTIERHEITAAASFIHGVGKLLDGELGGVGAIAIVDQSGALLEVHDTPVLQDGPKDIIRAQSGPPLPNFRQEAFAQLIAAGGSATAAYASAYGRPRDASSRVNGRRLLTNANIRARIAQIERDATLSSLSTIRKVLDAAGCTTVDRIRNGSFKQACEAADQFADRILKLSRALSLGADHEKRQSFNP